MNVVRGLSAVVLAPHIACNELRNDEVKERCRSHVWKRRLEGIRFAVTIAVTV